MSDETQSDARAIAALQAMIGKPIGAPGVAPDPVNQPMIRHWATALDEAEFIATLATNSEFEIVRYLRLGEVVTSTMVIESVSDRKQTRLGPGYFITWVTTYGDEEGEVVGRQMFRILKFKPDLEALLK